MTVREMHIEVQQSLQHVAANRTRGFLSEEVDWVLNKMMERYILGCLRPRVTQNGQPTGGFELDMLQLHKIKDLLVTGKALEPYWNADRYSAYLPADYQYLVADASRTTLLCGGTPQEAARQLIVSRLRLSRTNKNAAPLYETMELTLGGTTLKIPEDLPYGHSYAGYQEKEDLSFLVGWIRRKTGWYWERFGDLYYPGYFIHVGTTAPAAGSLKVDGADQTDYRTEILNLKTHPGTGNAVPNRLTPSELIYNLQATPHYKTAHYSPVSELVGNILYIHKADSFTVNSVRVSYVRKPQPISLSLNTDCEINPDFHDQICDLAVEYLKGRVENEKGTGLAKVDLTERVIL